MKKLFAIAMALFFMTATSGLVLAQGAPAAAPSKPAAGKGHKKHHPKKKKPVAAGAPAAPAGK